MKRVITAALMLAFAARAQDAASWWNALAADGAANPAPSVYTTLSGDRLLVFDDYADTAVWTHVGPLPNNPIGLSKFKALKAGTNHFHNTGWNLFSCRTGSARGTGNGLIVPPTTATFNINTATNLAANLQNTLDAQIFSPVFSNGIGTIYFEAVNNTTGSTRPTRILVSLVTNMMDTSTGIPTNIVLDAETETFTNLWIVLDNIYLNATDSSQFTRKAIRMNHNGPAKLRIQRWGEAGTEGGVYTDLGLDDGFTVIDNIRVSPPPSATAVYQSPDYTGLGYSYAPETP